METSPHHSSSSSARAEANRGNAQFSTGPRTAEGKARSSQNARGAGWFAQDLRLADDAAAQDYAAFAQSWREELKPAGLLELEVFEDFLRAAWHKREVVAAQNEATASGPAAFLDEARAKTLDRLHRYERDFERRAARHLAALARLQAQRCPPEPQKQSQPPSRLAGLSAAVAERLRAIDLETQDWRAQRRAQRAGLSHSSPATQSDMMPPTGP